MALLARVVVGLGVLRSTCLAILQRELELAGVQSHSLD